MRNQPFRYAIVLAASVAAPAVADSVLEASTSIARTTVPPQAEARQMLVSGDLEYAIEVRMHCADQSHPESLSLGVADTRRFIDLAGHEDASSLVSTLLVPGEQVAPIVTQGYCVEGDEDTHSTLQVNDILTMQLSLRCTDQSIHYLSQPLAVTITCAVSEDGQEASSSER